MKGLICSRNGVTLLWVAVTTGVLASIGALAIDLGQVCLARNELQNVADAAALAGASGIGGKYSEVYARARSVASENTSCGETVNLNYNNIEVGYWDGDKRMFTPYGFDQGGANAVRVTAAMTEEANNPVRLAFAALLGEDTAQISACATAVGVAPPPPAVSEPSVIYTVDCSDSMTCQVEDSKQLMQDLLQWAEATVLDEIVTKVGVVSFADRAKLEQALTLNVGQVYNKLAELEFGVESPEKGNNIGHALEVSLNHLEETPVMYDGAGKVTFLFTDGRCSGEEEAQAIEQAQRARDLGYPIYTFGVGKGVNESLLQKIARISNGEFYTGEEIANCMKESRDNYNVWLVR